MQGGWPCRQGVSWGSIPEALRGGRCPDRFACAGALTHTCACLTCCAPACNHMHAICNDHTPKAGKVSSRRYSTAALALGLLATHVVVTGQADANVYADIAMLLAPMQATGQMMSDDWGWGDAPAERDWFNDDDYEWRSSLIQIDEMPVLSCREDGLDITGGP